MKRSDRLEPVVRVAKNQKQQAASALGEAQTALTQAESRLAEFKAYREEYIRRFHEAGSLGMGAVQMEDYRKFLHNLSLAIDQQEDVVIQNIRVVEERRQQWFAMRGKAQMLDQVVNRYQNEEQRDLDRKEQGEQDERSQHPRQRHSPS